MSTQPDADAAPELITFGCRLNTYESEVMRGHLAGAGGVSPRIVVNTCAVTAEAVRQARQAIRRARRDNPDAEIVVTGCAAQIDPDSFAAMPEVSRVIGNDEKMKRETWTVPANERVKVNDIMSVEETAGHLVPGFESRARAFVQIQNGCDHRCTFCVIPYGRGNSRSVPAGEVVREIRHLVEAGYAEVVLTGVDITSYGADLPGQPKLGDLVQRIFKLVPDLTRLRLSSIDSVEVDETLMHLIAGEERLMPHLHLSLQAGDDMILKRMKRRHLRDDAIRFCDKVRSVRPDVTFGADLIAGFPTETDEMFENSLRLVEECGLTWLHVFPYSPRPMTPAARMPQLPRAIVKGRAERLRALGGAQVARHLAGLVGRSADMLMENETDGRLADFTPVQLSDGTARPGGLVTVTISGHDRARLIATQSTPETCPA